MEEKTVYISTPFIKLDSLLKLADLVSSGGEAKAVIQDGGVLVNDMVCTQRGKKLYPGHLVDFNGVRVRVEGK